MFSDNIASGYEHRHVKCVMKCEIPNLSVIGIGTQDGVTNIFY